MYMYMYIYIYSIDTRPWKHQPSLACNDQAPPAATHSRWAWCHWNQKPPGIVDNLGSHWQVSNPSSLLPKDTDTEWIPFLWRVCISAWHVSSKQIPNSKVHTTSTLNSIASRPPRGTSSLTSCEGLQRLVSKIRQVRAFPPGPR